MRINSNFVYDYISKLKFYFKRGYCSYFFDIYKKKSIKSHQVIKILLNMYKIQLVVSSLTTT